MHPALWKLMRLTNRASWRVLFRGARTLRGAVMLVLLLGGLVFYAVFLIGLTFTLERVPEARGYIGRPGPYFSVAMLLIFLPSVLNSRSVGHLHFTTSEVDFLFPGPFTRRELLLYKLVRWGIGIMLASLVLALSPLSLAFRGRLPTFVGVALAMIFIKLSGLAVMLTRLMIAEAAHTKMRRIALALVGILVATGLAQVFGRSSGIAYRALASDFESTWMGWILLSPFLVFRNAAMAERWFPDLLVWGTAGLAIDGALVTLVLKLDADYLEWSTAISQAVYERVQRMQRTGGMVVTTGRRPGRGLPRLPWIAGAGPVAARQIVLTARLSRGVVTMIVLGGLVLLGWTWLRPGGTVGGIPAPSFGLGALAYFMFIFQLALPVAFRGDIDHLDVLKALPIRPAAVAAGELAGCAAVFALIQLVAMGVYGVSTGTLGAPMISVAMLLFPVDVIILGVSSLAFLIYPVRRTQPGAAADANTLGRGLMNLIIQGLMMFPLLGVAAGLAAMAYLVSGQSLVIMTAAAMAALAAEIVLLTLLVGLAFDRFDPSTETPA
ncbi:MAG: putative ABC exporter domain-containing protein [Isosphaeraceae bacterium]